MAQLTMESTFGELLDDPRAKPLLEQYLPGVSTNPMVAMVRGVSLNQLLSMPQVAQFGVTREKIEALLAEANKHVA
jgi:hypothetical protein